jgi:FtsP/CotA-like multicopper oxidase with cupredoxin domain
LYGTVVVEPSDPGYWAPVNRDLVLTLDDILLENGRVAPFGRSQTTHTAMGRFGDAFLVSGEPDLELSACVGEVVKLYFINTANTRVFNVSDETASAGSRSRTRSGAEVMRDDGSLSTRSTRIEPV